MQSVGRDGEEVKVNRGSLKGDGRWRHKRQQRHRASHNFLVSMRLQHVGLGESKRVVSATPSAIHIHDSHFTDSRFV